MRIINILCICALGNPLPKPLGLNCENTFPCAPCQHGAVKCISRIPKSKLSISLRESSLVLQIISSHSAVSNDLRKGLMALSQDCPVSIMAYFAIEYYDIKKECNLILNLSWCKLNNLAPPAETPAKLSDLLSHIPLFFLSLGFCSNFFPACQISLPLFPEELIKT